MNTSNDGYISLPVADEEAGCFSISAAVAGEPEQELVSSSPACGVSIGFWLAKVGTECWN